MNKSLRFGLVLTPLEKDALSKLADVEGGPSQAATVRRLIRKEAQRRGLWLSTDDVQHHQEVGRG